MTDTVTKALEDAQRPITTHLWTPRFPVTFTPAVLARTFGDGRALFRFFTINNRPRHWLVRGDSSWREQHDGPEDTEPFADHVDEIVQAIADQFGGLPNMHADDEEEDMDGEAYVDDEGRPFDPADIVFPQIDDRTGCSWALVDWPDLPGVDLVPHRVPVIRMLAGTVEA